MSRLGQSARLLCQDFPMLTEAARQLLPLIPLKTWVKVLITLQKGDCQDQSGDLFPRWRRHEQRRALAARRAWHARARENSALGHVCGSPGSFLSTRAGPAQSSHAPLSPGHRVLLAVNHRDTHGGWVLACPARLSPLPVSSAGQSVVRSLPSLPAPRPAAAAEDRAACSRYGRQAIRVPPADTASRAAPHPLPGRGEKGTDCLERD